MKKYAIFDMDGTLIDSMGYWNRVGKEYLESRGKNPADAQLSSLETMTLKDSARYFINDFGVSGTAEEVMEGILSHMKDHYRLDIPAKTGIEKYLEALEDRDVRMCVATASDEDLASQCLARLGILEYFDFVVSCERVGKSKTEPDIYDLARRLLSEKAGYEIAAEEVAIYEDALFCARTAKAAGYYTIGMYDESYADRYDELSALADESYRSWPEAGKALILHP